MTKSRVQFTWLGISVAMFGDHAAARAVICSYCPSLYGSKSSQWVSQPDPVNPAQNLFQWPVLKEVTYPDGTKATYQHDQIHDFEPPRMTQMIDPRVAGRGSRIVYEFNKEAFLGSILNEKSLVIGAIGAYCLSLYKGRSFS